MTSSIPPPSSSATVSPAIQSTIPESGLETPRKFAISGIVALFVGKKRKKFEIHKNLLIATSKYFQAALAADWKEGKSNEVYWEDENVKSVELFVDWLYGKSIEIVSLDSTHLLQVYAFAHKRGMIKFKNHLMDSFRTYHYEKGFYNPPTRLSMCKDMGLGGTPIYSYIPRSLVRGILKQPNAYLGRKTWSESLKQVTKDTEISWQVLECILQYRSSPWSNLHAEKGCHYHDHSDGSACEALGMNE